MSAKVKETVKETAKEEFDRVRHLTTDAAKSGAYLYPLKGIVYFATHRSLWKPLLSKLAPTITLGLSITTGMFLLTYLPQAAMLALFEGPLAPISAIPLVLSESSTLLDYIAKNFLIGEALTDTFDGTLLSKDLSSLVSTGRTLNSSRDPIGKLGKLLKKPFAKYSPRALIRYMLYLPLNFIPVVGTVLFLIAQGRNAGPAAHERYFQLKGMSAREREKWIEEHKGAYASFGITALLLQLIPFAGVFFNFSSTVGAALWAADLERARALAGAGDGAGSAAGAGAAAEGGSVVSGKQETGVIGGKKEL